MVRAGSGEWRARDPTKTWRVSTGSRWFCRAAAALGAYQAGAYAALENCGVRPNWIAGTAIGAINADDHRRQPAARAHLPAAPVLARAEPPRRGAGERGGTGAPAAPAAGRRGCRLADVAPGPTGDRPGIGTGELRDLLQASVDFDRVNSGRGAAHPRRRQPGHRGGNLFRQRPPRAGPGACAGQHRIARPAADDDRRTELWQQRGVGGGARRRPAGRYAVLRDRRLRPGAGSRRRRQPLGARDRGDCGATTICAG